MYSGVPTRMPLCVSRERVVCPTGREPEVHDLGDVVVGSEQQVPGLDVAVHDAEIVRRVEALEHLRSDAERWSRRSAGRHSRSTWPRSRPAKCSIEIAWAPVQVEQVVDADDVRGA